MIKYFELVLDLLELEEKTELTELATALSEANQAGKTVLIAHRYAFLLKAWLKLCSGAIEPEEFVLIGDVDSAFPLIEEGQETSQELVKKLKDWILPEQDLIIVDTLAWKLFLTTDEQEKILACFAQAQKILLAK